MFNIFFIDCKGKIIVFYVILLIRFINVFLNIIIKFGKVLVNEESGYNLFMGKFIVLLDGVYLFFWIYCINKGLNVYFGGYVDGKLMVRIFNYV